MRSLVCPGDLVSPNRARLVSLPPYSTLGQLEPAAHNRSDDRAFQVPCDHRDWAVWTLCLPARNAICRRKGTVPLLLDETRFPFHADQRGLVVRWNRLSLAQGVYLTVTNYTVFV